LWTLDTAVKDRRVGREKGRKGSGRPGTSAADRV